MAISKEDVLEYISGLSVLELSELVREFEEKFGVSANPTATSDKTEKTDNNMNIITLDKIEVIKSVQNIIYVKPENIKTIFNEEKPIIYDKINEQMAA